MEHLIPDPKRHPVLALALAPLAGALFCIFLPFVGFVLVIEALVSKLLKRKY